MAKNTDRTNNLENTEDKKVNYKFGDILRRNVDDVSAMNMLRNKLGDAKLAEQAFEAYKERKNVIMKKAEKFKNLLVANPKYSNLRLDQLILKAKKYKKKYGFGDDEFHAFINLATIDRVYANANRYNQPSTIMSKALGYNNTDVTSGTMQVPNNELDIVQDILRLHGEFCNLHEQVRVQSLVYEDCAPQALTGGYDRYKNISYNHTHPVIAALFFPRIRYIDEHMLHASISNIVNCRFNNLVIRTLPDYELYWDLITDPNDLVCASSKDSSPLADLRNRVKLQIALWKAVYDLREGRFYTDDARHFMLALDTCRNNVWDVPDMCNIRDEGTIIRKLFAAFSLRPTFVKLSSLSPGMMTTNYNLDLMSLSQVTNMAIINKRLPIGMKNRNVTITLSEALEQPEWFVENKMIVIKVKSIIYSRDIVVFYANRRYQTIDFAKFATPCNFTVLPPTHSGLESLNDIPITFEPDMHIGDDRFYLRSVVLVERALSTNNLIVGSSAVIISRPDYDKGRNEQINYLYHPQAASIITENDRGEMVQPGPIQLLPTRPVPNRTDVQQIESLPEATSTRGTIFIYVKENQYNCVNV